MANGFDSMDDIEFGRIWSSRAGEASAWRNVVGLLEQKAADAFVHKKDDVAYAFRQAAAEFQEHAKRTSQLVQDCINEDRERRKGKPKK